MRINETISQNFHKVIRSVTEGELAKEICQEDQNVCLRGVPELSNHGFAKNHHDVQEVIPVSTQAIREYLELLWKQYQKGNRAIRGSILDEITRNLGLHRKAATRLMGRSYPPRSMQGFKGGRRRKYSPKAKLHLERLWRAMGYLWPQRMKVALPEWLIHDDHRDCDTATRAELLAMSASTIGRLLKTARAQLQRQRNCGTRRGVRRFITKVPIRNFEVVPDVPGHCEIDCVAHCGGSLSGTFAWTLTLTDIATGWTESEAVWGKDGYSIRRALETIERRLPFALIALYCDNGSEFLNEEVIDKFAVSGRATPVRVYRGRPYRKNDQAYVEQKNYTHVRAIMGYGRIDWERSISIMNSIYRKEWRDLQNFYLPQQKLLEKMRIGAKVIRRMDGGSTPFFRLIKLLDPIAKKALEAEKAKINPFRARHNQRCKIRSLLNNYKDSITKNEWGKMAI